MPTILSSKEETDKTVPIDTSGESMDIEIENKKDDLLSWDNCYNPKDFGWKGTIKNPELDTFLNTKFDVLISYYEKEILELKLITVLSKAELKVGILQTDERINDLIIKTKLKEFEVFKEELFKYLTILNKIKK